MDLEVICCCQSTDTLSSNNIFVEGVFAIHRKAVGIGNPSLAKNFFSFFEGERERDAEAKLASSFLCPKNT